jgi:hydrogenase maturation factor HypE
MRIVTCSRDTIISPISQFIFRIIKELKTTLRDVVCNKSNFITIIADVELNQDEYLASLDITLKNSYFQFNDKF